MSREHLQAAAGGGPGGALTGLVGPDAVCFDQAFRLADDVVHRKLLCTNEDTYSIRQ